MIFIPQSYIYFLFRQNTFKGTPLKSKSILSLFNISYTILFQITVRKIPIFKYCRLFKKHVTLQKISKEQMKKCLIHSFCIVILMAFISYWASINLFGHIHIINGTRITHSHPFTNDGDHNHSNNALFTIFSLSNFNTDDIISHNSLLNFVAPYISEIKFSHSEIFRNEPLIGFIHLRAPPVH